MVYREDLPVVVVHGGAWNVPDELAQRAEEAVMEAALCALQRLKDAPEDAIGAVEEAVRSMENNPVLDAGVGSCLTEHRQVEMDAVIMCGKSLKTGAVACVNRIRHPISLARMVMERTDHCLLAGEGANKFARQQLVPMVEIDELVSPEAVAEWEKYDDYSTGVEANFCGHDTVGCVVLTKHGNFACGTSTGGINRKKSGRVGDSPLVGCGAYCDDAFGGASSTGHGESIMKVTLTRRALFFAEQGMSAQEASKAALAEMLKKTGGHGGLILVTPDGSVAHEFNTPRMPWAVCRGRGVKKSGINPED